MQTNLGSSVLSEKTRFRGVLTGVPDRLGHGRLIEVTGGEASLQGSAPDQPGPDKEEGWFVNLDSVQVLYETKYPDGKERIPRMTTRTRRCGSTKPGIATRWCASATARCWAMKPATLRPSTPAAVEPATQLPLSTQQHSSLTLWNISH